MKYESIKNGKAVTILYQQSKKTKGGTMNFSCCDCGLVHNIVIVPLKTRLKLYFWRDNKLTKNRREVKNEKKSHTVGSGYNLDEQRTKSEGNMASPWY